MIKNKMPFDAFKAILIGDFGEKGVTFRQVGQHGWTSLTDILDRKPGGNPGPHWCDVSYVPARQMLAASYDFNTDTATFYYE